MSKCVRIDSRWPTVWHQKPGTNHSANGEGRTCCKQKPESSVVRSTTSKWHYKGAFVNVKMCLLEFMHIGRRVSASSMLFPLPGAWLPVPQDHIGYCNNVVRMANQCHLEPTQHYRSCTSNCVHLYTDSSVIITPADCVPKWKGHGPLVWYVKLWVAHAPVMPGTFSPQPQFSDPRGGFRGGRTRDR